MGIPSPPRVRFAEQDRQSEIRLPSDDLSRRRESEPLTTSPLPLRIARSRPRQISKGTALAIRYALEAVIFPNHLTPDLIEENASMSDLTGGGPSTLAGTGRSGNSGGTTRMYQSSAAPVSAGIRAPTVIMRERVERERRKRELEAQREMDRANEEDKGLLEDEGQRRAEKKPAVAAGIPPDRGNVDDGYRGSGSAQQPGQRASNGSQRTGGASGSGANIRPESTSQGRGQGGSGQDSGTASGDRPRGGQPRPVRAAQPSGPTQVPQGPSQPPPPQAADTSSANATRRTTPSFPQAFERWESLSAHWEGLTSYWLRRIDENSREIQRDPISAQLARQVQDLSAAGANLFHAVVDLQRLRVSSQKKFQRWLFEMRAEQERSQEMQGMLEATLQEERRGRTEAIGDAVAREREKLNSEKLVAEMRRELHISKEEARRAWEELGRREQEERERTASLREGQPTIVGGVQVVPMIQTAPTRHTSTATRERPPTREGPYAGGPGPGAMGGQSVAPAPPLVPAPADDMSYPQSVRGQRGAEIPRVTESSSAQSRAAITSPTPTTESPGPVFSEPPANQATTSAGFYQQQHGTTLHQTEALSSEGTYSDVEYEIESSGQFRRDSRGHRVRYEAGGSDDDTDEFDLTGSRDAAHLQQYGHAPTSGPEYLPTSRAVSTGRHEGMYVTGPPVVGPADYSGQGYGTSPVWDSVARHHHPTRLSDVLEEDEKSSTVVSRRE